MATKMATKRAIMPKKNYDGWVIERTIRGERRLEKRFVNVTEDGCWIAGYYAWREEWELFYAFKKRMIAQGTKPVKVRFIKVED